MSVAAGMLGRLGRERPSVEGREPKNGGARAGKVAAVALACVILLAAGTRVCAGQPPGLVSHDLTVRLDLDRGVLEGVDRISFSPLGSGALTLALSRRAELSGMDLDGARALFSRKGGALRVKIPPALRRRELTLVVTYRAAFQDRVPENPVNTEDPTYGVNGTISAAGVFLDAGAGWYPGAEDRRQEFRVRVEAPEGVEAVTEGKRLERGSRGGTSYSVWEISHPVSGLSLSAGRYVVRERDADGIPVYTYFYPENDDLSEPYLKAAARFLSLYRKLLGPYPFPKFAVVENFFPTGYGFPSYTLLGKQIIRFPFILHESLGHEIAHSWWGNGVLVDYRHGNWSEGLTTYVADYLYRERKSPEDAREYRVNILRDYATLVPPGKDFPLSEFVSRDSPASRAIGYGKAAMVFHMVRRRIGDDAFWNGLRDVVRKKLFQKASWDDFADAFGRRASQDLHPFFHRWVDRPGAPVLSLTHVRRKQQNGRWFVTGSLSQHRPWFNLRVPVVLQGGGGSSVIVPLRTGTSGFRLSSPTRPVAVEADPDANVFRRLDPSEIPPTVNRLRGSSSLVAVVSNRLDPAILEACRPLLESLGLSGAPPLSEAGLKRLPREAHDVLFLGLPEDTGLLATTSEGLSLSPRRFTVAGARYDSPEDALFAVLPRAPGSDRVSAVFLPLSAPAARKAALKIVHYGKYSYLVFRGGTNQAKGTWPVTTSPVRYRFAARQGGPEGNDRILDVKDRAVTSLQAILPDLESARITFVGELHDQPLHHWAQLKVIEALHDAGVPLVVGLEMFERRYQWALDDWVSGRLPTREFRRVFARNWEGDYWPLYRDIFLYARDHRIRLLGLNLSRSISDRVATEGFAALTPAQRADVPEVTSCNVGPDYRDFIQRALGHAQHGGLSFTHFCEAQLLWDTTMAARLVSDLEQHPSTHAVVLAGSGHCWKPGIPAQVERRSDLTYRVILPEILGHLSRAKVTEGDADYLWLGLTRDTP